MNVAAAAAAAAVSSPPRAFGWLIDPSCVDIQRDASNRPIELGKGGFGRVFRAKLTTPAGVERVALKQLLLPQGRIPPALIAEFEHEVSALSMLSMSGIVRIYGAIMDPPDKPTALALVLEECGSTDLFRLMRSGNWAQVSWVQRVGWAYQLAHAVEYLHMHGVYHRDLKSPNILFSRDGQSIKVTDLGLCSLRQPSESASAEYIRRGGGGHGVHGTLQWLSPENFGEGARVSLASTDVYALGAVLMELASGRMPFAQLCSKGTETLLRMMQNVADCIVATDAARKAKSPTLPAKEHEEACEANKLYSHFNPLPDSTPRELEQLIRDCMNVRHEKRPAIGEVLKRLAALHPQVLLNTYTPIRGQPPYQQQQQQQPPPPQPQHAVAAAVSPAAASSPSTYADITAAAAAALSVPPSVAERLLAGARYATAASPSRCRPECDKADSGDEYEDPYTITGSTLLPREKQQTLHEREYRRRAAREEQRRELLRLERQRAIDVRVAAQRDMERAEEQARAQRMEQLKRQ